VFGAKNGWERANYFKPAGAHPAEPGLGRPQWLAPNTKPRYRRS